MLWYKCCIINTIAYFIFRYNEVLFRRRITVETDVGVLMRHLPCPSYGLKIQSDSDTYCQNKVIDHSSADVIQWRYRDIACWSMIFFKEIKSGYCNKVAITLVWVDVLSRNLINEKPKVWDCFWGHSVRSRPLLLKIRKCCYN